MRPGIVGALSDSIFCLLLAQTSLAADWPMGRADAARSGYTAERLPEALSLRWTVRERHAPQPAWPLSQRLPFDRAYQVVVAGGTLYYGTSADDQVMARDAATGQVRWTYVTDGPVRFAPAVWQDRVLVASDDGFLYCLAAADGRVYWKLRGGPRPDMLLGNDRMIARWPARGGPVVVDGIVYFGVGIWPSEGVFLYAVDVVTGKTLWCNDSSGSIEMDQPHPGARAKSGIAIQGALAVEGNTLWVPTGRAVPAAVDREDGKLRYFHLQANRGLGGSEVVVIDGHFFNAGTMFASAAGAVEQALGTSAAGVQVAAHPRWIIYAAGNQLVALDRQLLFVDKETTDRKGSKTRAKTLGPPAWTAKIELDAISSLIVAGDVVVAGGKNHVVLCDAASGQTKWTAIVHGTVYGLAVSDGRLVVSTDQGSIACFGGDQGMPIVIESPLRRPEADEHSPYALAAQEIVERGGVTEGYGLDLACGEGRLALELARRTKLRIYAVDVDPAKVQAARQMLAAAGLYGVRATVHQADPVAVSYPNYFADLIVSGRSVVEGVGVAAWTAVVRCQRPCGGVICLGRPGAMQVSSRGALEGAADWTHQYADAGNTLCSGDTRLQGPLAMLWFRDTDLLMPSRHGRGPAPLVADGRMFVEGIDGVRAINVYNGATLWEFPLPGILKAYHQDHLTGAAATGSNLCLGGDRLFVHAGPKCLCLDVRTGKLVAEWNIPSQPGKKSGTWGYLAYRDGTLFGTLANEEHVVKESWRAFLGKLDMTHQFSESRLLFALDPQTGKFPWMFTPQHSIRYNAIASGPGRVYLIDRPLAGADTPQTTPPTERVEHPPGRLLCLDASTGKELWQVREDIFGTVLALSEKHDVLVMSYQPTSFKLDSEVGGRLAAYRASDGQRLWSVQAKYKSRPVLNDRTLYAEPGKWDLLTGERLPFEFKRSYGCGVLAGSSRLLVYRSATLGYWDLEGSQQTENYGGIRPGCWVNAIPAGGLVLMADAASWCTCSYLNQATIALQPVASQ
ncbi:MAG: PQQ-binding-like beta-propeller repeat protein [Planctomycetota bacterium]|nr:PQQ-binding-like beta-propeller repeat protein [Planctomycetota bacterium]